MTITLPKAIAAYFDADRHGGPEDVAAAFTVDGIVKDKGKTHGGRDAVRAWMADQSQQYSYTVEPFLMTSEDGKTLVTAHASGDFRGSPIALRFFFVLEGDKVAELEITV